MSNFKFSFPLFAKRRVSPDQCDTSSAVTTLPIRSAVFLTANVTFFKVDIVQSVKNPVVLGVTYTLNFR